MATSFSIVTKANELYTRYCKPVAESRADGGLYHRLNRFDPVMEQEAYDLIKSFVDEILEVTETEIIGYDLTKRTGPIYTDAICPPGDSGLICRKFTGDIDSRCRPVKNLCEPLLVNGNRLKTFVPQIYHVLQDHGFFHRLMGLRPSPLVRIEGESRESRLSRINDKKMDDLSDMIEHVLKKKLAEQMFGRSPQHVHRATLKYIKQMESVLDMVHFLRAFDTKCCSDRLTTDSGHSEFDIFLGDIFENIRGLEKKEMRSYNNKVLNEGIVDPGMVCSDHEGECVFII